MRLYPPRSVVVNDHQAFMWSLLVDQVPYVAVWWISDGTLRVCWQESEERWSPFVPLGSKWSPRRDVRDAQATIRDWATALEQRYQAS